jgi:proton glutamate symport protein
MWLNNIPPFMQILITMILGLVMGAYTSSVFMGVDAMADAVVMLLQMTALPYISLSLIVGIGGLSPKGLSSTFKQSLLIVFLLMTTVLFFIFLAPIAFPDWTTAEFYSVETIKVSPEFDLVKLFIPANPFNAFANSLIPSVMFAVCLPLLIVTSMVKKFTFK